MKRNEAKILPNAAAYELIKTNYRISVRNTDRPLCMCVLEILGSAAEARHL